MLSRLAALAEIKKVLGATSGNHEAELMLMHVLGLNRSEVYQQINRPLTPDQQEKLLSMAAARRDGLPLQYLTGEQAFGSLVLQVGKGVLVPRPETELVAERAVEMLEGITEPRVVDVGTGCGAIALFVASKKSDARVWATDASAEALSWAERNLTRMGLSNVELVQGDLLAGLDPILKGKIDLVVSNPPYLSEEEYRAAPPDVREHEPKQALVSGDGGVEATVRLLGEAFEWLRSGGKFVFETGPGQFERVQDAAMRQFEGVTISHDLAARPRILEGSKP